MNRMMSILMVAAMSACGGSGPQQNSATPPTSTPATPAAAASGENRAGTTIWMHKNSAHGDLPSPCLGTAVAYVLDARRNEIVRWRIEDDGDNNCPGLNKDNVELHFNDAIWLQPPGSSGTPISTLKASGGQILARILNNETTVPNRKYKYTVYYSTTGTPMQASPDPEVDVDGSCPGCAGK